MKFEVTQAFGHARVGDVLLNARWIDDGAYAHGWLRATRTYREFVIPTRCISMRPESPADLDYHARRTDPETAHREMDRHSNSKLADRHQMIIDTLRARARYGATSKEMAALTGIPHVSTSTTMSKLLKRKLIAELPGVERDHALVRVALEFVNG